MRKNGGRREACMRKFNEKIMRKNGGWVEGIGWAAGRGNRMRKRN